MLGRALPRGVCLSRLHWGGGTPTLLQPGMIDELAGAIRDIAPFTAETEFSVEIDPGDGAGTRSFDVGTHVLRRADRVSGDPR